MSRDNQLVAGFLSDGFDFKGTHYKPLTAQTLLLLEKVKSPYFTGENRGVRSLLDYLFVSSSECAAVLRLAKDEDTWELAIAEYASNFSQSDLEELGHLVAQNNEGVSAAVVEAREEGTKKK